MSDVHIDWYSFTLRYQRPITNYEFALAQVARSLESRLGKDTFETIFTEPTDWVIDGGRKPYAYGWYSKGIGCWVWYGGQSTVLVEFTGRGVQTLRELEILHAVIENTKDITTRLDIAIDIDTQTTPIEFVAAGYNKRIKARRTFEEKSGTTVYIGSRKSDKFCRVYRYNEPHPRSDKLRIEYEMHRGQAKIAASYWLAHGTTYIADMVTKYYDWKHKENPIMDNMIDAMPSDVSKRSSAKTLIWLIEQVAPAFRRLVEEGVIQNPDEFIEAHFKTYKEKRLAMFGDNDDE